MADALKVLGQIAAAATTTETLYTVPDVTMTTTSSLTICNRTAGAITVRISIHVAGAGADDKQFIFYDKSVPANDTLVAVLGLTLNEGDVIKTYASATGLSINLFGVETS